jgi:hypothetical protein
MVFVLSVTIKNVIVHRRGAENAEFIFILLSDEGGGKQKEPASPGHLWATRNGNIALKLNYYAAKLLSSFPLPSFQRQRKNHLTLRPPRLCGEYSPL